MYQGAKTQAMVGLSEQIVECLPYLITMFKPMTSNHPVNLAEVESITSRNAFTLQPREAAGLEAGASASSGIRS